MIFSKKLNEISPSVTLSITAQAKKMRDDGIDVIGFGAGEPDFNTPENIIEAAIVAMKAGHTKYTSASGIIELKEAIINKFSTDNNLTYKPSQIIISTGAKQCLSNTFQAIINPGDEIILPSAYWVTYPELIKIADGIPVYASTTEESQFKYTSDSLNKIISNRTKAIVVNSPNNPTGAIYTLDELKLIADFAKKHDIIIISDEIYEKLIYDNNKHISIASVSEDSYKRTIVINGFSKSYSMTGWRIGYAAGDENIIKLMTNLQSHTTSNPNSIAQYAALEALNGNQDSLAKMINEFKKRRDYMYERINKIDSLFCVKPKGAFYILIDISKIIGKKINENKINNSIDFSNELLREENVAVIPGNAFGISNYIRLSYATSMDNIIKGLDRIENFMKSF